MASYKSSFGARMSSEPVILKMRMIMISILEMRTKAMTACNRVGLYTGSYTRLVDRFSHLVAVRRCSGRRAESTTGDEA